MNAKQLLAALSLAVAATGSMAFEATQFDDPVSSTPRAEVKADARVVSGGEATEFAVERTEAPVKSREEVRAQAREGLVFNDLYIA